MFTGLVQSQGSLLSREGSRFAFVWPGAAGSFVVGESISVNGCCLTVVGFEGETFFVDAIDETLARTNLNQLGAGTPVNLERPMSVGDSFGGHMVLGHVDTTGIVMTPVPTLRVAFEDTYDKFVVEKGSVAIDGVSLTVSDLGAGWLEVSIIPHTATVTTLGLRTAGDKVNLEFDIIAKHVAVMIEAQLGKLSR